jgi:hypothetical protein
MNRHRKRSPTYCPVHVLETQSAWTLSMLPPVPVQQVAKPKRRREEQQALRNQPYRRCLSV